MKRIAILIVVVVALGAAAYFFPNSADKSAATKGTGQIQATTAKDLVAEIKKRHAKATLVNFWASWCEPCKQEFPSILQVKKEFAGKGLEVIFVSLDESRDLNEAQAFLNQQHVDFPIFYKGDQPVQMVSEILPTWQGAIPTSLIFDAEGKLADSWEGDATLKEFREKVKRQLEGK